MTLGCAGERGGLTNHQPNFFLIMIIMLFGNKKLHWIDKAFKDAFFSIQLLLKACKSLKTVISKNVRKGRKVQKSVTYYLNGPLSSVKFQCNGHSNLIQLIFHGTSIAFVTENCPLAICTRIGSSTSFSFLIPNKPTFVLKENVWEPLA